MYLFVCVCVPIPTLHGCTKIFTKCLHCVSPEKLLEIPKPFVLQPPLSHWIFELLPKFLPDFPHLQNVNLNELIQRELFLNVPMQPQNLICTALSIEMIDQANNFPCVEPILHFQWIHSFLQSLAFTYCSMKEGEERNDNEQTMRF